MKKKTNEQLIVELQQQMWSLMTSTREGVSQIKLSIAIWAIFLTFVFLFVLGVTYG